MSRSAMRSMKWELLDLEGPEDYEIRLALDLMAHIDNCIGTLEKLGTGNNFANLGSRIS
jgi:hypothetical protein